jgi:hypothetical protein
MTRLKKLITTAVLAVTMITGASQPAFSQVKGGEEECDYTFVLDDLWFVGGEIIPIWHLEVNCVTVLDN